MFLPNGEDVAWAGAVLNRDKDCPKLGVEEELAPNGHGVEPKIDGSAADVEEPKAGKLKAGAAEVPNPEDKGELFGTKRLELGVVVEKGLAADWYKLKPVKPVDWIERCPPKF